MSISIGLNRGCSLSNCASGGGGGASPALPSISNTLEFNYKADAGPLQFDSILCADLERTNSQFFEVADSTTLPQSTHSFWLAFSARKETADANAFVGQWDTTLTGQQWLCYENGGSVRFIMGGSTNVVVDSGLAPDLNDFFNGFAYFDRAGGQLGVAVGNLPFTSTSVSSTFNVAQAGAPLRIGKAVVNGPATWHLDGRIDQVVMGINPASTVSLSGGLANTIRAAIQNGGPGLQDPSELTAQEITDYGLTNGHWWKLREASTDATRADSQGTLNLTANNTPGTGTPWCRISGAMELDASGPRIAWYDDSTTGNLRPASTDKLSLAAWAYLDASLASDQYITCYGDDGQAAGSSEAGFCLKYDSASGKYQFSVHNAAGASTALSDSINTRLSRWVHLCGVRDGVTLQLYRDGALAATSTTFTGGLYAPQTKFFLGARSDGLGGDADHASGRVSGVRYFKGTALGSTDVKHLYNQGKELTHASMSTSLVPTASYDCREGWGSHRKDASGSSYHLDNGGAASLLAAGEQNVSTPCATTCSDGQLLAYWDDQSGSGRNLRGVSGTRPTFNSTTFGDLPAINFGGYMSSVGHFALDDPFTVFAVLRNDSSTAVGTHHIFDAVVTTAASRIRAIKRNNASGNVRRLFSTASPGVQGSAIGSALQTIVLEVNGAASRIRVNGPTDAGPASHGTAALAELLTLGANSTGGEKWIGKICEVVGYSGTLSVADLNSVGQYLERWGTTWIDQTT